MEFLSCIGDWLLNLRERLDHEARLMPFILSALNDEVPDIAAAAVRLLDQLGAQYEKDNEKVRMPALHIQACVVHSMSQKGAALKYA